MHRCAICKGPLGPSKPKWYVDGKPVCFRDAQSAARAKAANSKGYCPMPERVFREVLREYLESAK